MRRALFGWGLVLALGAGPAAAGDDAGVASPLMLGSSARALALGRSGAAYAAGADAVFWNAARLGAVERAGLSLFHTQLFADGALYDAGFVAYPSLDVGTFALGFQRLDVGGIERRDDRNQLLGTFDNTESSLMLGYGRHFGRLLACGAAVRLVQQSIDAASDASVGLDLGMSFERSLGRSEAHRIGFGINLQNVLTPRLRLRDSEVADPRNVKLGAAYQIAPGRHRLAWLVAADVDVLDRAAPRLGAGLEVTYRELLALRAGVDGTAPTFGFGIGWRNLRFDYALVNYASLDRGDRFSLELHLGGSVGERRLARQQTREAEVSEQLAEQLEQRETQERLRARAAADSAYAARRFDDALRSYRRVLALDPTDATAIERADAAERELATASAATLLQRGAAGEAAAAFQAILDRWPAAPRAAQGLEESRTALQESADRGRQINGLLKQALVHFSQNDPVAAQSALQELLRLDPNHEVAQELVKRVQATRAALGDQAVAQARAAAARGDFDAALTSLAEARRCLGARPEFKSLEAAWSQARREAAITEDAASQPPEPRPTAVATTTAKKTLPSAPQRRELDARYHDGLEAFGRGDFPTAIRSWRMVWTEWPEYPSVADHLIKAYLCEGIEQYSSGKYEAAIELCRRVLEIDPANAKAKRYLQRMLEEKSELQAIGGGDGAH